VVGVAFDACVLDRAKKSADGVDHAQQGAGDVGIELQLAVAEQAQQAFADVRDALELAEGEEATRALDRVDRPEHAGEQRARVGLLLQRDEVAVELVQILVTLHEELLDDLVHSLLP